MGFPCTTHCSKNQSIMKKKTNVLNYYFFNNLTFIYFYFSKTTC